MIVSTLACKHFRFEFNPDNATGNLIVGGKTYKVRVDKTVRHVNGKEWDNPADGSWNQRVASCVNAGTILSTERNVDTIQRRCVFMGFTSFFMVVRLKHRFTIHFTVMEGDEAVPFVLENEDDHDDWDWFHDRDGWSDETQ